MLPTDIIKDIIIDSIKSNYLEVINRCQFMLFKIKHKQVLNHIKNMFETFENCNDFLYDLEDRFLIDYQHFPILN